MVKTDSIALLTAALRGAGARQQAIAGNIANAQTPGYKRQVVQFEQALARALRDGRSPAGVEPLTAAGEGVANDSGNNVDLDVEIGDLIKTTGAQKTYVRLLNKIYRQIEQAAGGV